MQGVDVKFSGGPGGGQEKQREESGGGDQGISVEISIEIGVE